MKLVKTTGENGAQSPDVAAIKSQLLQLSQTPDGKAMLELLDEIKRLAHGGGVRVCSGVRRPRLRGLHRGQGQGRAARLLGADQGQQDDAEDGDREPINARRLDGAQGHKGRISVALLH